MPVTPNPHDAAELRRLALAAIRPDRASAILRRLVDTPSPTGSERACAEALAALVLHEGLTPRVDAFGDDRANVVADVGRDEGGLRLLLNGHLDTTGFGDARDRGWLRRPYESDSPVSRFEDGIVSGLGAYNMKGGVAAAAEAVCALRSIGSSLPGLVSLAAVAGESEKAPVDALGRTYEGAAHEGGGVGTERLLEHGPAPDAVVICEPSGLAIVNAQPGYVLLQVIVHGRAGYLPAPGMPTVVTVAADLVRLISSGSAGYAEREALDTGLGTLRPPCTVGAIESGWPFKPGGPGDAAALYLDLRVPPGRSRARAVAELRALVDAGLPSGGGFGAEFIEFGINTPGALTPAGHPLVEGIGRARAFATGIPPGPAPDADFPPGDDGKAFARRGIPYVKMGPGSPASRDPRFGREQVRMDEVVAAARTYVCLAVDMACRGRDEIASWPPVVTGPD